MNLHDRDNFMRGKKEGINEKAIETAKNFLQMGISIEQVAQGTNLPLQTVEDLAKKLKNT